MCKRHNDGHAEKAIVFHNFLKVSQGLLASIVAHACLTVRCSQFKHKERNSRGLTNGTSH